MKQFTRKECKLQHATYLYKSVVESVIFSAIICWGRSKARDLKRLNNLVKKAGSVMGMTLELLEMTMQ